VSDKQNEKVVIRGLEGVVAAETRISYVDGANGKLYYQGYDIDELAGRASFAETVYLLWYGRLPNHDELFAFRSRLVSEMRLPTQVVTLIQFVPPTTHPMSVLRTMVSALAMFDPDAEDNCDAANERKAGRLLAQTATIIADLYRTRQGKPVLSPDPNLGFAANFLYMFRGTPPDREEEEAFDLTLMLHADHGMNASTFAGRVTASTLSDMHSALTSAIGTLKGPLHGGANQRVMQMLDDINNVDEVESYIEGMLNVGQRIMGFGHRVYKTEDPRARHLRDLSQRLCERAKVPHLYDISRRIEKVVHDRKGIYPNVDFYSATVQHALQIPDEYFTTMFAVSRVAGWVAHIREQFADNRLIRPTSKYLGRFDRRWEPINQRG
jgi:citrate synthase